MARSTPHQSRRAYAVRKARVVDHVGHLLKAHAAFADELFVFAGEFSNIIGKAGDRSCIFDCNFTAETRRGKISDVISRDDISI